MSGTVHRDPGPPPAIGNRPPPPERSPVLLSAPDAAPAEASPKARSRESLPARRRDTVKVLSGTRRNEDPVRHGDTWARIRTGLSAPYRTHPRVVHEINWYRKHQKYLHRTAQQARPYLAYIVRQIERRDMPMEFALLPIIESGFQPYARSSAGASGLWQFMPATGKLYGLKQNWWYDGRRDIVAATRAALDYLSLLSRDFDGDWLLAVAAYNWGEGNVKRAVAHNRARGRPADIWSLRLPRETRTTVSRLLAISAIVADPERYSVVLKPIPDRLPFEQVELGAQIDLHVAADLAGITLDEIYTFNTGFNPLARATAPDGPHRLQLPRYAVKRFRAGLARTSAGEHVRWISHKIAHGDTLGAIAARYRTNVVVLMHFNRLVSDRIYPGGHLMVPIPTRTFGEQRPDETVQARLRRAAAQGVATAVHVVRRGDSLWGVARRYGVSVKQLAAWNGLSTKTVLRPGQRLTVHDRNMGVSRPGPAILAAKPAEALPPPDTVHVVERGDTLYGIARRYGTTVRKLAEFNRIDADAVLHPGQRVRIVSAVSEDPPVFAPDLDSRRHFQYRVKRGDSLWRISRQFGVSIAELREWNQLSRDKPLMPGRELDVRVKRPPAI